VRGGTQRQPFYDALSGRLDGQPGVAIEDRRDKARNVKMPAERSRERAQKNDRSVGRARDQHAEHLAAARKVELRADGIELALQHFGGAGRQRMRPRLIERARERSGTSSASASTLQSAADG